MSSSFINSTPQFSNIDTYVIRMAIFRALQAEVSKFSGKFLDIGCGKMPYRSHILQYSSITEYVGLDIETARVYDKMVKPDLTWDGVKIPLEEESFESAMATEVLEHCPEPEVVLKEVYRILKQDGIFFFTVPFLWNLHEVPNDEYRYTPFSLQRHLQNAGFKDIQMRATGGWHAAMAQMLGLWIKRSGLKNRKGKLLYYLSKPIIKQLLKKDQIPKVFKEGQMITGLTGIAYKR